MAKQNQYFCTQTVPDNWSKEIIQINPIERANADKVNTAVMVVTDLLQFEGKKKKNLIITSAFLLKI